MILSEIITYILLGFTLSAPIGPINIKIIDRGLKAGFLSGWFVGLGAMTAEILSMLIIFFGVSSMGIAQTLLNLFWFPGSLVLLYLGISGIKEGLKKHKLINTKSESAKRSSYLTGFILAATSPMNYIFWLGIYTPVITSSLEYTQKLTALFLSLTLFIGVLIWDLSLALFTKFTRKFIKEEIMKYISITFGIILIEFSIWFLYKGLINFFII